MTRPSFSMSKFFLFQAEDGIRDYKVTGVQTCALPISLLPEKDVAALANELSGETAKRNLEGIARFHRQRGSQGFHEAAELVAERARAYGLSDVAILQFPADGKIFYGTQRSRPGWDAEFAELWEVHHVGAGSRNTLLGEA